jgi:hypothetical protein
MKYILKKAEISSEGGFIGDGKSTPIDSGKDSWIIKQITQKKPLPGIKRKRDKDGLLKFSSMNDIVDSIFYSFSNVEKNYSIVKSGNSFGIRMAWSIQIFCNDDFLEIKDVEKYSQIVADSAREDLEMLMVRPIRVEGVYDLEKKIFSICAVATIPVEFVDYVKNELTKLGF